MKRQTHWLVRPYTLRILWIVFIAILVLTLIPGLFIRQHETFGIEAGFGFYAWYGFITCVAMVLVAKLLGLFLKRRESYYDE